MTRPARHGLGDPRIPWVVLLDVAISRRPGPDEATRAMRALAEEAGWPTPGDSAVVSGERRALLDTLASDSPEALRTGLHEDGVILAARHDALDGVAMLTALGALIGSEVRASPRGVDPTSRRAGRTGSLVARGWEVGVRPQARVARSVVTTDSGDAFASTTVDAVPHTSELVLAGARAVASWNRRHGARATRVTVAVGASTAGRAPDELADRSALMRISGVEQMTAGQVRERLLCAPVQPSRGTGAGRPLLAAATDIALRAAAPRLGSTLLVSHLGKVEGPATMRAAAFYPVTGGGSGLSLGGATVGDRTTLTLRARATRFDDEGLQDLLALVVGELR